MTTTANLHGDVSGRRTTSRARPNSRGDATRQLILLTAEQLFAERGISAVPLRDIGVAAGQRNNGVVQYHFGDRESLVREIMALRAATSEEVRVDMLADLTTHGQPEVLDLVRVFVMPLAEHLEEGNSYLAFMSRYIIANGGYSGLGPDSGIPHANVDTLRGVLSRLLPDWDEAVLDERWLVMQTCTIHTLARYQAAMVSGEMHVDIDTLLDDLVRFLTAGILAPLSSSGDDGNNGHSSRPIPAGTSATERRSAARAGRRERR